MTMINKGWLSVIINRDSSFVYLATLSLSLEYSLSIVCWSFAFDYCRVGLICAFFFGVKATKTYQMVDFSITQRHYFYLFTFLPLQSVFDVISRRRADDDDEDDCCCCCRRTCLLLFCFIFGNSLPACSAVLADATELRLAKTSYLWRQRSSWRALWAVHLCEKCF